MDLAGKIVLVKFVGIEESELIKIDSFNPTGIWFHNEGTLARMTGAERPAFLGDYPAIFVPLTQIEALVADDKDTPQATPAQKSN